jgi:hypothetical protein
MLTDKYFLPQKHEFQVTVVIKKFCMQASWWYTACDICKKTAKPYGRAYRCGDPTCPPIVSASPRLVLLNQKILSNRELLLLYDN